MTPLPLETRLRQIEERLERLERLAFLSYSQLRDVAEYAYRNVHFEIEPDEIKRIPKMHQLNDSEGFSVGMTLQDLAALKWRMIHLIHAEARRDALTLARDLAQYTQTAKAESEDVKQKAA